MVGNSGYAHITFIMDRPKNFNDEIKTRIKATKIVSSAYNSHTLPYDDPATASKSGAYATVNDKNPLTFTIDVYVPKSNASEDELKSLTSKCEKELRNLSGVKRVICYNDTIK